LRNYRDKFDIIADILQIAKKNPKKTRIMYQANLSYKVFKKYLAEIVSAALILYIIDERCYTLTDKGKEFLILYYEYSKVNTLVQKKLKAVQKRRKSLEKLCTSDKWASVQKIPFT